MMDGNTSCGSQKLIMYTSAFDEVQAPKIGKQLSTTITLKDIATKKRNMVLALVDSRCARTCVNEKYARQQGWLLEKIKNLIPIEYADGTVTEESKI
jgi:hypothetical protein